MYLGVFIEDLLLQYKLAKNPQHYKIHIKDKHNHVIEVVFPYRTDFRQMWNWDILKGYIKQALRKEYGSWGGSVIRTECMAGPKF